MTVPQDKHDINLSPNIVPSLLEQIPERFNLDEIGNPRGKQLIEMCRNCDMYIVNGRTRGDIPGKLTCLQSTGRSTVDYVIAHTKLLQYVQFFNVNEHDLTSQTTP